MLRSHRRSMKPSRLFLTVLQNISESRTLLRLPAFQHIIRRRDQLIHQMKDLLLLHPVLSQHLSGDSCVLLSECKEKVLRPDIGVSELPGSPAGILNGILSLFCVWYPHKILLSDHS